jgi:hypothetical protein
MMYNKYLRRNATVCKCLLMRTMKICFIKCSNFLKKVRLTVTNFLFSAPQYPILILISDFNKKI